MPLYEPLDGSRGDHFNRTSEAEWEEVWVVDLQYGDPAREVQIDHPDTRFVVSDIHIEPVAGLLITMGIQGPDWFRLIIEVTEVGQGYGYDYGYGGAGPDWLIKWRRQGVLAISASLG